MTLKLRLCSEDPDVFEEALGELRALPVVEALGIVEEMAIRPDEASRWSALDGMAVISPEKARNLAIKFLADDDPTIRTHATYHFLATGDGGAIPQVSDLLLKDPDEIVRAMAATYLGAFGDESVLPALMTAVEHDMGGDHQGKAISGIARESIEQIITPAGKILK